jgi:hypothetical protein
LTRPVEPDPWLPVCERCPLADCVRKEGELGRIHRIDLWFKPYVVERIKPCPIMQAQQRGWQAAEALARAEELKLLPAWVEM